SANLVIADLTDHNPNVFYELAIRHIIRKPIVQLIQVGQKLPFDIAQVRTVEFNLADPDELLEAVGRLRHQIKAAERNPAEADNPISSAIDLQTLKSSGDPNAKANAEILELLRGLSAELSELKFDRAAHITRMPEITRTPDMVRFNVPIDVNLGGAENV